MLSCTVISYDVEKSVQTITRSPANNNNTGELQDSDPFLQRLYTDVAGEKNKLKASNIHAK